MQVIRRLLPRSARRSETSKAFGLTIKTVLRRTSKLRDLDTLMETLDHYKAGIPSSLLVTLGNRRSDSAAGARAVLDILSEVSLPEIDRRATRRRGLSKRLSNGARKDRRLLVKLLPDVLEDETKAEELHSLRKEVKKLRYLLELSEKKPPELALLTGWQKALGEVHDLDVAVSFLEGEDFENTERATRELRRSRHQNYLKFIKEYRADSIQTLPGSRVLAGASAPHTE